MASRAASVQDYLDSLPADRREAVEAIRATIRKNLDPAFEEGMQYGMIGYYLPHSVYPAGYHCDPKQPLPFASIASQKAHIGIYLFCIYCDEAEAERFRDEWLATGKRLDMGKGCIRVKRLEDTPLAVIGRAIRRATAKKFVAMYEASRAAAADAKQARKASAGKPSGKKTTAKRPAVKSSRKKV
jgi:hypothetical protein